MDTGEGWVRNDGFAPWQGEVDDGLGRHSVEDIKETVALLTAVGGVGEYVWVQESMCCGAYIRPRLRGTGFPITYSRTLTKMVC